MSTGRWGQVRTLKDHQIWSCQEEELLEVWHHEDTTVMWPPKWRNTWIAATHQCRGVLGREKDLDCAQTINVCYFGSKWERRNITEWRQNIILEIVLHSSEVLQRALVFQQSWKRLEINGAFTYVVFNLFESTPDTFFSLVRSHSH